MTVGTGSELQYLLDRQAIEDVLKRYARGVDRHDEDIMRSVFHEDAIDNHGPFVGGREIFPGWVNDLHAGKTRAHSHNITCHSCEIDGDTAWTETYVAFVLYLSASDKVMFGSGRYVDRFEKRNGEWRIALRRTMTDSRFEGDSSVFDQPDRTPRGRWDRSDISYDELAEKEGSA
ncbi:MAG: nuclear transport factor 2 family protein [Pseudomonadota bacterium]|nr:nuclear transport factor 2 family protein [Pseudomonadota bacterium]